MSEEVLVDGFALTKSWLQNRVERIHGVRPRVGKVEPLGKDAVGYMSVIRRVWLEWDSDRSELPKSVIVKIPCPAAANKTFEASGATTIGVSDSFLKASHGLEANFYRLIQEEKQKRLLVPIIYASEDFSAEQPVIVMQDYRNCFLTDLVKGLTEKQLFDIAEQIANLQVFSIKNRKWITTLQKDETLCCPKRLTLHCKRSHLCESISSFFLEDSSDVILLLWDHNLNQRFVSVQKEMWNEVIPMMGSHLRPVCQKLMEDMPEHFSCLKTFMANTIDKDPDWMAKIVDKYRRGERPFVLIHGDLWAGQILWRDESTIEGIVDWQGARHGSPVEDFLRILSSSATVEMRRKLLQPLLDFYYDKMSKQLGADMPFSREHLRDELKYVSPLCCIPNIFNAAFLSKSEIAKKNGVLDKERINAIAHRSGAFVEDVIELCGWNRQHLPN
ncbi:hypothetical protein Y032_0099g3181 [Ancylostoma ceylanicum]|uniref:CHK kinase-like domain-containing protein n=1 Tax=Ancylostoma ceylanicum TaxID=53326 RepID=A0A016TIR9_9BILA|nr:hypothetical protein Y032_0099g3181 [Ancylostoma ceylanicum]